MDCNLKKNGQFFSSLSSLSLLRILEKLLKTDLKWRNHSIFLPGALRAIMLEKRSFIKHLGSFDRHIANLRDNAP